MILQQPVHREASVSTSVDYKKAIASEEISCGYSVESVIGTEVPELAKTTKGDTAGLSGILQQLELFAGKRSPRVAFNAKGKIFFIEAAEIMAVHSVGNYCSLQCGSSAYLLREPLSSIATKLKPYGLIQIHRSVLVNGSLVDEVRALSTGEYRLRVRNGKEYVVTRRYKDNLRHLAHVWLGSERLLRKCGAGSS